MHDVAAAAGVSQATVSLVLNSASGSRFSEDTRKRVRDAVNRLGYRTNAHAKVLRDYSRVAACGVVVPTAPHGSLGITWDPVLALNDAELERMREGVLEAATLYFNAGADEILPATAVPHPIRKAQRPADEQAFLSKVRKSSDLMLSSAHPQGVGPLGQGVGDAGVPDRLGSQELQTEQLGGRGVGERQLDLPGIPRAHVTGHAAHDDAGATRGDDPAELLEDVGGAEQVDVQHPLGAGLDR